MTTIKEILKKRTKASKTAIAIAAQVFSTSEIEEIIEGGASWLRIPKCWIDENITADEKESKIHDIDIEIEVLDDSIEEIHALTEKMRSIDAVAFAGEIEANEEKMRYKTSQIETLQSRREKLQNPQGSTMSDVILAIAKCLGVGPSKLEAAAQILGGGIDSTTWSNMKKELL